MDFPRKEYPPLPPSSDNIPLEFQITDIYIPEADKFREKPEENDLYSIVIFGVCDNGATVCVNTVKYEPYFYIKPPESWENLSDSEFKSKVSTLNNTLKSGYYEASFKGNSYNKKIVSKTLSEHYKPLSIVRKKDFWGFTNNKVFRFIKVSVKSLALYNAMKYYFSSREKEGFKLYESNIDPSLKYIHIQDIKPCGWVRIEKYKIADDLVSRCNYNIRVNAVDIHPVEINKIAPLLITSFDIECTSSHGDFPMPIKTYKKVAQDFVMVVKAGYEYDKDYIINWIQNIFRNDIIIDEEIDLKINRVYPKKKVTDDYIKTIPKVLESSIPSIITILDKISKLSSTNEDDSDDEAGTKRATNKEFTTEEDKLTEIFDKKLPNLKGDEIIQIGTTVHRYGSDNIIYKNIITLNTCNPIKDCDVVVCKTEKELIMTWKDLMNNLNSDVVTGYNIFGFDMEYIWNRAIECNTIDEFSVGLGRIITKKCGLIKQELSSSAMGENILKYFDMDGTVLIDLFKVMQRDQKLDSYKLDNVASIFLGDKKNDLKPNEIFKKFKGDAADRCEIAEYCIQDCVLINRLIHKLKILENNIGMGNVCLVPLNYLFRRGQGIKIFSLIAKKCMDKDLLIPVIKSFNENRYIDDDGYEGAVVLDPKEGIYLNDPIVVFDYGSLYPSSMIARNLSHDCYVLDKKYMVDDPNIEYMTVNYDIYEGLGDKKKKTGVKECIFAQYKDGKKGIIAEILNMLLVERKNTRNKIEYKTVKYIKNNVLHTVSGLLTESDDYVEVNDLGNKTKINRSKIEDITSTYNSFEQDVFDAVQIAYKITANSLYGQIGARTSPIYLKEIAACTTATGREMIMLAKNYVETKYNAEVIYGDSVMPYTPITIKDGNNIEVSTFEKLDGEWFDYSGFKVNDIDRFEKEQFIPDNKMVWTDKGWSKIKRIIRHKTTKKIYRIVTHTGLVDVTEDHSLLDINRNIIKPSNCKIGTELLHSTPDINRCNIHYKNNPDIHEQLQQAYIKHTSYNNEVTIKYTDGVINLIVNEDFDEIKDNKIANIILLHEAYNGYVYDIETEEGVFHAGIGNMILKNTDSIFCKFPLKDEFGNQVYGKDSLKYAIEIGKHVEKNIVSIMPKPQKLNYEKSLYPFIIFSKKRYVGNLYENSVEKFKQKSMGIVLKRRDNAPIVKKIYGGIIDILLNKQDLEESIIFLKEELDDLVNGKAKIDDLVISKSLRGYYKDPTKIAHKVLADRIGARDPGNRPAVNDRIPFVYIKVANKDCLQGDRIENPEYIVDNNITPDYLHYITNQIMKPVLQLYALCLDELPGYNKANEYWTELEEELKIKPIYQDDTKRKHRIDNLKLNMVKELLFDEYIYKLSEPKVKKIRTAAVIKKIKPEDTEKTENIIIKPKKTKAASINGAKTSINGVAKEDIIEDEDIVESTNIKATIKVTKNAKTNKIIGEAHITKNGKKIWTYKNEEVQNKEIEIKNIILNILEYDTNAKYDINVNNKSFIKEYNMAYVKYLDFIKNHESNNNLVVNAINTNDIGILKDVNLIRKFEDILILKEKFKFII